MFHKSGSVRQLCREPRNRADADIEGFRNVTRCLAFGNALARFFDLVGREYRLAPHLDAVGARDLPPFVGALDDAKSLIFRHSGHHRHEAAPYRGREVDVAAIKNLDAGSGVDHSLDDLQAVPHRARGAIPFSDHELVAAIELLEGGGQLRTTGKRFPGRGIRKDARAPGALQRLELPRDPLLVEMEALAKEQNFPISDPEVATFLGVVTKARAPRFVVELGTNIGYGAIVLSRAAGPEAKVLTIEYSPEHCTRARAFIGRARDVATIRPTEARREWRTS